MDRRREHARTDGRTTFPSKFGVKALHFEHRSFRSCVLPPSVRTATIERIYRSWTDRRREHARTDGRTTFLSEFGVKALHFKHQSLDCQLMRNMLNADYGCRVHSTSSASRDMMLLDASCHMVASTVLVTIMHPSNAWSLILLTVGGITFLRSDVHPQNALFLIFLSPLQLARCTCVNHVQSWNAHSLIALLNCPDWMFDPDLSHVERNKKALLPGVNSDDVLPIVPGSIVLVWSCKPWDFWEHSRGRSLV